MTTRKATAADYVPVGSFFAGDQVIYRADGVECTGGIVKVVIGDKWGSGGHGDLIKRVLLDNGKWYLPAHIRRVP